MTVTLDWMSAAFQALDEYQTQQGKPPTEAVISTKAAYHLAGATGQANQLLGYPVVISNTINGIYFQ